MKTYTLDDLASTQLEREAIRKVLRWIKERCEHEDAIFEFGEGEAFAAESLTLHRARLETHIVARLLEDENLVAEVRRRMQEEEIVPDDL